jgi:hypothetical protein
VTVNVPLFAIEFILNPVGLVADVASPETFAPALLETK